MEDINRIIKQTANGKIVWTTLTEFCVNYEDAESFLNNMLTWIKYNELLKSFKSGRKWSDSYIAIHQGEIIMFLPLGDTYIFAIESQREARLFVSKDRNETIRLLNAIRYSDVDTEDVVSHLLSELSVH